MTSLPCWMNLAVQRLSNAFNLFHLQHKAVELLTSQAGCGGGEVQPGYPDRLTAYFHSICLFHPLLPCHWSTVQTRCLCCCIHSSISPNHLSSFEPIIYIHCSSRERVDSAAAEGKLRKYMFPPSQHASPSTVPHPPSAQHSHPPPPAAWCTPPCGVFLQGLLHNLDIFAGDWERKLKQFVFSWRTLESLRLCRDTPQIEDLCTPDA